MDTYSHLIIDAVKTKMGDRDIICPVSGSKKWKIQKYPGMVHAMEYDGKGLVETNFSFPFAVLVCEECGYSLMFNLFHLGVAEEMKLPSPETDMT